MKRGQGAFEYILMLAGILLIVILIVLILQNTVGGTGNSLNNNLGAATNVATAQILPNDVANLYVLDGRTPMNVTGVYTTPCWVRGTTNACNIGGNTALRPTCPSGYFNNKTGAC